MTPSPDARRAQWIVEAILASLGVALLLCAVAANQQWLDRHFLPSFFLPRPWYVLIETAIRVTLAALGLSLALIMRRRNAAFIARSWAQAIGVVVAALLAIVASEVVLRTMHLRPAEWLVPDEEPRRQPDPRLGWTLVPGRTGRNEIAGRTIDYTIDRAGYRVRSIDEPVDAEQPTILFIGESVMFGEGLTWNESVPAQVGSLVGIRTANLAVHGYSNDQAYLRLQTELPRFRHPVAVVAFFMTALFGRNLDTDRPHLGPGLLWLPAQQQSRLLSLAKLLVPYRSDAAVERGVRMTREVLHATVDLARSRGATPLIVVPQLGEEDSLERSLRHRVLDDAGLPYVLAEVDSAWRLSWDRHPNAHAARLIAEAIAAGLRR